MMGSGNRRKHGLKVAAKAIQACVANDVSQAKEWFSNMIDRLHFKGAPLPPRICLQRKIIDV